jgi:hypothetical protein
MKLRLLLFTLIASAAIKAADALQPLRQALTLHASFDRGLDADFSRGDPKIKFAGVPKGQPAGPGESITIVPGAGRFGGAMHVTKKNPSRPYYAGPGAINYNSADWSGSVSVWLRLTPDEDLEPGYCDPVQIIGDDSKKGFMFLEWSKDEKPRHFRYAIRPLVEIWNPRGLDWAKMTDAERPMVALHTAPFSRERWTHVVFTFHRVNTGKSALGELFLDGKSRGVIRDWDLRFGWQADKVQLVLAAAYVGHMDDLAVFDRALTATEVAQLFALKNGIRDLR